MIDITLMVLCYAFFVYYQSLFINGIFISAHGETQTLPDGSKKHSEMILNGLYRYLTQKKVVPVFYTSFDQARKLMEKVNNFGRGNQMVVMYSASNKKFCESIAIVNEPKEFEQVLSFVDPDVKVIYLETASMVSLYKEETVYRFSKYIRKPIIQCIICMASFWGFFTYWLPVFSLFGLNWWTFGMWIANTVILSYTNFILFEKKH